MRIWYEKKLSTGIIESLIIFYSESLEHNRFGSDFGHINCRFHFSQRGHVFTDCPILSH
jgi:hypothetical protein